VAQAAPDTAVEAVDADDLLDQQVGPAHQSAPGPCGRSFMTFPSRPFTVDGAPPPRLRAAAAGPTLTG
jgi:hypothetical protein